MYRHSTVNCSIPTVNMLRTVTLLRHKTETSLISYVPVMGMEQLTVECLYILHFLSKSLKLSH